MTKEELAARLNGREYGIEMSRAEEKEAEAAGLVVVYGASDDLMEFLGAIDDELGAYEGTICRVDAEGLLPTWERVCDEHDEAGAENYFKRKPFTKEIKAIWDRDGYSWIYETDIPHATFEINDEGGKYCRGIVFALADLAQTGEQK